jgi:hypothetical protein
MFMKIFSSEVQLMLLMGMLNCSSVFSDSHDSQLKWKKYYCTSIIIETFCTVLCRLLLGSDCKQTGSHSHRSAHNRGTVGSSVFCGPHRTTAIEELCFLHGPCRGVVSGTKFRF